MPISPISDIIADLRQDRMVIIMDDEDRENEGDLLIAAEVVRPEHINFMAKYGRGLVCLTLTAERCQQLQLPLMVNQNTARHSTKFTVSIEAARGVTTGISAADRAATVQAAVARNAKPPDLVQPGHIFPLMAQRGGVLARGGHTEAGIDLARLAGFEPASVICEILKDDGSMARLPELEIFAAEHGLKIGTIADLIRYRLENESTVQRAGESVMPTEFGDFRVVAYHDDIDDKVHLALVKGEIRQDEPVLVRVHVQESLLDLFTSAHRESAWTLRAALRRVAGEGSGVVVILNQPESPARLAECVRHFQTHTMGLHWPTSAETNELRMYGLGGQILADLGVTKMRVIGHPRKAPGMSGFGLEVVEYVTGEDTDHSASNKEKRHRDERKIH